MPANVGMARHKERGRQEMKTDENRGAGYDSTLGNRLTDQQRSSSCYDLDRNIRIERKSSALNVRRSSRSGMRNTQDDHWKPQYRSSSEPGLSHHRVDIPHCKDEDAIQTSLDGGSQF